jgi:hypothetical protein
MQEDIIEQISLITMMPLRHNVARLVINHGHLAIRFTALSGKGCPLSSFCESKANKRVVSALNLG